MFVKATISCCSNTPDKHINNSSVRAGNCVPTRWCNVWFSCCLRRDVASCSVSCSVSSIYLSCLTLLFPFHYSPDRVWPECEMLQPDWLLLENSALPLNRLTDSLRIPFRPLVSCLSLISKMPWSSFDLDSPVSCVLPVSVCCAKEIKLL